MEEKEEEEEENMTIKRNNIRLKQRGSKCRPHHYDVHRVVQGGVINLLNCEWRCNREKRRRLGNVPTDCLRAERMNKETLTGAGEGRK